MTNSDSIRGLLVEIQRQGWRVERTQRHFKCFPPDASKMMVTLPSSCSGRRGYLNYRAQLRRQGAKL